MKRQVESWICCIHARMKFFYLTSHQVEVPRGDRSGLSNRKIQHTYVLNQVVVSGLTLLDFRSQGGILREIKFAWITLYMILFQPFPLYLDHENHEHKPSLLKASLFAGESLLTGQVKRIGLERVRVGFES